jgi:hypothetical protein
VGYLKTATGTYAAAMGFFAAGLIMTIVVLYALSRSIPALKPAVMLER